MVNRPEEEPSMTRLTKIAAAAALVAAAVALAGWSAARGNAATPASTAAAKRITLLSPPGGKTTEVIPGKNGPKAVGDEFITTGAPLVQPVTKAHVGHVDSIVVIASDTFDHLSITAHIGSGTLEASGEFRDSGGASVVAVTGGTGSFAGAQGTLTITELGDTGAARLAFVVRR
jgi:hypothetical protein